MSDDVDLNLSRQPDGSVLAAVMAPNGRRLCDFLLSPDMWAAAVAGVSAQGAAPERVALVRNFHMHGAKPPAEPGWDANGSPVDESAFPTGT